MAKKKKKPVKTITAKKSKLAKKSKKKVAKKIAKKKSAKKISKKKVVKKLAKKKLDKKLAKKKKPAQRKKYEYKYKRVYTLEAFYKAVNQVQIKKVIANVHIVDIDLVPVCKNVLKDTNLSFEEQPVRKGVHLTINPNFEEVIIDVDVEELEDEFLEDGQIF